MLLRVPSHMSGHLASGYKSGMNLSSFGPWIAIGLVAPALVVAFAAALALRGAQPEHRAEILKALAVLALALLARRSADGPRSRRRLPPRELSGGATR
jgi:hypothetical protein